MTGTQDTLVVLTVITITSSTWAGICDAFMYIQELEIQNIAKKQTKTKSRPWPWVYIKYLGRKWFLNVNTDEHDVMTKVAAHRSTWCRECKDSQVRRLPC